MKQLAVIAVFGIAVVVAFAIVQGLAAEVIVLLIGVGLIFAAMQRPIVMLGLAVCSQGFNIALTGRPLMLTPFKLAFAGLAAVSAAYILRKQRIVGSPKVFFGAMLVMLFLRAISNVLSTAQGGLNELPEMFASGFLVLIAAQFLVSVEHHRSLMKVYLGVLLVSGAWVLWEAPPDVLASSENFRALGPARQPNATGADSAVLFFLSVPMLLDRSLAKGWRLLTGVGVAAFIYIQFATSSRGVLAATLVALPVLAFLLQERARARITTLLGAIALLGLIVVVAPKSTRYRVESTVKVAEVGDRVEVRDSARLELASMALEMIRDRPFFGHGEHGFKEHTARYLHGQGVAVHTAYLGVAVAFGLPFAIIWTSVLLGAGVAALWLCLQATGPPRMYYAGLASMLVFKAVFSVSGVEDFDQISWLHVGMAYHYLQLELEARRQRAEMPAKQLLQPSGPRILNVYTR